MNEIDDAFCPDKVCKGYGLENHGNITVRGKYGKDKTKDLLYCRTCGKRFASTRATAFFGLHLSDEKIEQITLNVGSVVVATGFKEFDSRDKRFMDLRDISSLMASQQAIKVNNSHE